MRTPTKVTITHEYTNSGAQQRSYGNHIWDGFIEFTTAWHLSEVGLRNIAERYVRFFATEWRREKADGNDGMGYFYSPYLVDLSQVSSNGITHRWHYRIEQHYLD